MSKKIDLEEIIKNTIIDTLNPKLQNPGQALGIANRMIEKDWYVKSAMLEFGKQLLELAAENAITAFWGMHDYHGDHDCFNLDEECSYTTNYTNEDGNDVELSFHFDKQSITNTIK
jgi:hypothetical protein